MTSVLCDLTGPGCLLKNTFLCQDHFAYLVALTPLSERNGRGLGSPTRSRRASTSRLFFLPQPLPYSGRIFRVP